MDSSLVTVERTPEVWGAESAGYNACGGADGAGAVQGRCKSDAGAVQGMQRRCRLPAPSAPPRALYPVQGGAGGAGHVQAHLRMPWLVPSQPSQSKGVIHSATAPIT